MFDLPLIDWDGLTGRDKALFENPNYADPRNSPPEWCRIEEYRERAITVLTRLSQEGLRGALERLTLASVQLERCRILYPKDDVQAIRAALEARLADR